MKHPSAVSLWYMCKGEDLYVDVHEVYQLASVKGRILESDAKRSDILNVIIRLGSSSSPSRDRPVSTVSRGGRPCVTR